MAWVRIDDKFPEHDKIVAAGGDAAWLHVCALAYCNRNETDGRIPANMIHRLSDRRTPIKLAVRLVDVGLWEHADDGYMIHDYLEYQPSRAQRDAERAKARERMEKRRRTSPDVQANGAGSSLYPGPGPGPEGLTTEHAAAAVPMSTAAAAAVDIYVESRILARKPDDPAAFARHIRNADIPPKLAELAAVNGDEDPVKVAVEIFGLTSSQAIKGDYHRRHPGASA